MKNIKKNLHNGQYRLNEEKHINLNYAKNNLPEWYNQFSFHDCLILNLYTTDDYIELEISFNDENDIEFYLRFYSPNIIENCNLIGGWCISNELYLFENSCELHLIIENCMNKSNNLSLEHFIVSCSNMELLINNKSFKVFNNTEFGSIWDEFDKK